MRIPIPFRRRRKRLVERLIDRLHATTQVPVRELRARATDPSGDTLRLSFVTGLLLGLLIGVGVSVALRARSGWSALSDTHRTSIELLPAQQRLTVVARSI